MEYGVIATDARNRRCCGGCGGCDDDAAYGVLAVGVGDLCIALRALSRTGEKRGVHLRTTTQTDISGFRALPADKGQSGLFQTGGAY